MDADAVLAGATTARSDELVFSVWHREMVTLRRQLGDARHPAQAIVCSRSAPRIETALMFQEPEIPVFLITSSDAASSLRLRVATRPWIQVIDGGQPLSMRAALRELKTARHRDGVGDWWAHDRASAAARRARAGPISDDVGEGRRRTEHAAARRSAGCRDGAGRRGNRAEEGVRFAHYALGPP